MYDADNMLIDNIPIDNMDVDNIHVDNMHIDNMNVDRLSPIVQQSFKVLIQIIFIFIQKIID